jgi:hypothetical protein
MSHPKYTYENEPCWFLVSVSTARRALGLAMVAFLVLGGVLTTLGRQKAQADVGYPSICVRKDLSIRYQWIPTPTFNGATETRVEPGTEVTAIMELTREVPGEDGTTRWEPMFNHRVTFGFQDIEDGEFGEEDLFTTDITDMRGRITQSWRQDTKRTEHVVSKIVYCAQTYSDCVAAGGTSAQCAVGPTEEEIDNSGNSPELGLCTIVSWLTPGTKPAASLTCSTAPLGSGIKSTTTTLPSSTSTDAPSTTQPSATQLSSTTSSVTSAEPSTTTLPTTTTSGSTTVPSTTSTSIPTPSETTVAATVATTTLATDSTGVAQLGSTPPSSTGISTSIPRNLADPNNGLVGPRLVYPAIPRPVTPSMASSIPDALALSDLTDSQITILEPNVSLTGSASREVEVEALNPTSADRNASTATTASTASKARAVAPTTPSSDPSGIVAIRSVGDPNQVVQNNEARVLGLVVEAVPGVNPSSFTGSLALTGASSILLAFVALALLLAGSAVLRLTRRN